MAKILVLSWACNQKGNMITKLSRKFLLVFCGIVVLSDTPASARINNAPFQAVYKPNANDGVLPPKEFDHPVDEMKVRMTLTRADVPGIKQACDRIAWREGYLSAGCAKISPDGGNCHLYILHDSILQYYRVSFSAVFRHERAHCNGWRDYQAYK
jgi:hypothetical protein